MLQIDQFLDGYNFRKNEIEFHPQGAWRLFNGFLEGQGQWVIELYGKTLLMVWYGKDKDWDAEEPNTLIDFYRERIPYLNCVILKERFSENQEKRQGRLLWGEKPEREIMEAGVRYALDLQLNQDSSFYLDTRNLRKWLISEMENKRVLNTFAYTGSLGVAAAAGGAAQVVQTDLKRRFLNLAKTSYTLNGFPIQKNNFLAADFFNVVGMLKKEHKLFDCVILDPPFFSETQAGKVDLVNQSFRLINKLRPLVNHAGYLVVINNALFLKGTDFMGMIEDLSQDGYLKWVQNIPVPFDITGDEKRHARQLPADPAPFNHATKIAVLQVLRKDQN